MKKTVMAFGSFDILHKGHITYLNKAKRLGDRLIVVVARNASIKMLKHRDPFFDERDRVRLVSSLKMVNEAVLGNRLARPEDRYAILKKYRPDVAVFGYDQRIDIGRLKDWLRDNKINTKVVRIGNTADVTLYKSSKIRKVLEAV